MAWRRKIEILFISFSAFIPNFFHFFFKKKKKKTKKKNKKNRDIKH